MQKRGKNLLDKVNQWAQNEAGFDDGYEETVDELKDYSGSAAKVFNVFMIKDVEEYKKITECLNRGSACAVNLGELSEEDRKATIYRIEGILHAVNGCSVYLSETVMQLLPKEFVVRAFN